MKKLILLTSFFIAIAIGKTGFSQIITAPSASYQLTTAYTNGAANDAIFGFCTPNNVGSPVTGSLSATVGAANSTFIWTIFNPSNNTYDPFTTQTGLTTSTLTGLTSGGYHVTIKNGGGTVIGCDLVWVWVNQTTATVGPIAAGCSPFNLSGTASAVSNFVYYNPPPEPFLVSATTSISVCFNATHTFVSDLGFFLVGPATCGSPTVTLSPNPGANGQGAVCNSGDNVNNLCFTTTASPNFNPCTAAAPYSGTYDSYGVAPGTNINWTSLYGCDAAEGGWRVQIYDCIGADVGSLTGASISFNGNSGCGASTINYNSGAINSAINDNSCSSATASIYTVPGSAPATPITIVNNISFQWTSVPATTIPNSTTSLTPSINPPPAFDTWYYLTVTDNFGCSKKDSAFFDYSPPGLPTINPAGPFCSNAAAATLSATPTGGTWSGTGITNAAAGTFNPATAGAGTWTITYTTPGICGGSNTTSIVVNPIPTVTVPTSTTVCNNGTVPAGTFTTNPGAATVNWTNNTTAIGLAGSGSGNIASFTATNGGSTVLTAVVTATPFANGCTGTPVSYNIIVNPTPTLNAVTSQTVCNTVNTAAVAFVSVPAGATVNWTNSNPAIGVSAGASGNIASFTGTNLTSTQISGNFTATPTLATCVGAPISFSISVDPTPVLTAVPSETVCAGAATTPVNYTTTPVGASIAWTNSNPAIGIGASGNGDIASFTTTNPGSTQIVGNFSAVPTLNTCVGAAQTFAIAVNPIPVLTAVTSQTVCEGTATTAINYTSTPVGATVNWTNSVPAIGLAASGNTDIASFTGLNGGTIPLNAVVTATPTLNTCVGAPITFGITVSPAPSLAAVPSQTVCEGAATTAITFTPTPAAVTTINWTNSATSIGQPAVGSGDIASYTATNGTGAVVNAAFVATPVIGTCFGTAVNFTITVNPAVTANAVTSFTVCNTATVPASAFASTPTGATFVWTNSDNSIGLGLSGNGDYPSFTGSNLGTVPVTATITVVPTLNTCVGPAINYNITINPTPAPPTVANVTYCLNEPAVPLTATAAAGGTLNWWGTSAAGGTSSASGPIPPTNAVTTINYYVSQTVLTCESPRAQIQVVVSTLPSIVDPADIVICSGDIVPIQVFTSTPTGAVINWSNTNASTGLAASGVGDVPSFTASNTGLVSTASSITVIPNIGSCIGSSITYTVTVKPLPTVAVTNTTACNTATIPVITWTSAPAGASFNWVNSDPSIGTAASGTTNIPSFAANNGGSSAVNAVVTVTPVLNACTGTPSSFTITVNPTPPAPTGTGLVYCMNDAASQLTATGTGLLWYTAAIGGVSSATAPTPSTASVGSTSSFVSQTILGCESPRTQVTTVVNGLPTATLVPIPPKCPPLCTDLVILSSSNLTTYAWDLGDGSTFMGNDTVVNHCYGVPGTYSVTVTITDNNSCQKTIVYPNVIHVSELPVAQFTFGPQPASLLNPTITFISTSIGSAPLTNSWVFGDSSGVGNTLANIDSPEHTYEHSGSFNVQLVTANALGCLDTTFSTVVIENDFSIYVPNAFSPNDDGMNDSFYPKTLGIDTKGFKMFIFDRWGNMIYFTEDITKPWSGKVQGKDNVVLEDIYVWKINCKSESGQKIEKSGHVTVVR